MNQTKKLADLRQRAKAILSKTSFPAPFENQTPEQLIEELQIHQIQLELQLKESRAAFDALKSAQARYKKLLDLTPGGYVAINTEGHIQNANLPLSEMLGVKREELYRHSFAHYVMPDFQDIYLLSLHMTPSRKEAKLDKIALRREDGTSFPALLSMDMPDKKSKEIYIVILDISSLEEGEAALRDMLDAEEDLNQERLTVLSLISYEFRKPLARILSTLELLRKHGNKLTVTRRAELFQSIRNLLWYLSDTVQDAATINAFEEQAALKLETLDLLTFSRNIIHDLEALKPDRQKISLDTVIHSRDSLAIWDANLFRRILMNLLSYTFNYSTGAIRCRIELKKTVIRLYVEQEGTALSKTELSSMFDEFCAGKKAEFVQGRGNGLFTVYNAVQAHGGTMDCELHENGPINYIIELPRHLTSPSPKQQ
jgi:PAS domain S-box-containing protein